MNEPIEANMQITKPNNSNLIQKKRPKLYCIYSSTCLEPQLEVDEDDGRGVGAEPEAELVELLRVGDVAGQSPHTSWRPAPEQELQVVIVRICSASPMKTVRLPTHPKKTTIPCQRAVQNQRRNSLLLIIRF